MKPEHRIHGGLLARNTALNLVGSIAPLAVAVLATPFLIRRLGVDRFGVLLLTWTILWYSSYSDLRTYASNDTVRSGGF